MAPNFVCASRKLCSPRPLRLLATREHPRESRTAMIEILTMHWDESRSRGDKRMQVNMMTQDERRYRRDADGHPPKEVVRTQSRGFNFSGVIAISLLALTGLLLAGCQSTGGSGGSESALADSADSEPLALTTNAYHAFVQGDCADVERRIANSEIKDWPTTEVRHSLQLLSGFCEELAEQNDDARETYRAIIREAPLSFASDDARERLRIMRLAENDPDYESWVASARVRALGGSSLRAPLNRTPVAYPPLALRAGISGYAVVEFGVTPRGATDSPVVVESDPPLLFDGTALRAVRSWRYARDTLGDQSERQAIRLLFRPEEAAERDSASDL